MACAMVALALGVLVGCGGPESAKEAGLTAGGSATTPQASKYWKKDGWWNVKSAGKKVMITEFSVEYVTEHDYKAQRDGGLGLGTVLDVVGVGDRKYDFAEDFKVNFPTTLYNEFVKQLSGAGYEVIPMATVTGHPAFAKIEGAAAGTKGAKEAERGLVFKSDRESNRATIYPTPGLPTVDDSWFKGIGNAKAENQVAGELGADLALRVRVRVGIDEDGRAVLNGGASIRVQGDYEQGKTLDGLVYGPKTVGFVRSKQGVRNETPVVDSKEFKAFKGDVYTVNSDKFRSAIMSMYPNYVRLCTGMLKG